MAWLDGQSAPYTEDRFPEDGTGDLGAGTELDAVVGTGEEGTTLGGGDGDTVLSGGDGSEVDSLAVDCFPKLEAVDAGDYKTWSWQHRWTATAGAYGGDGGTTAGFWGAAMRTWAQLHRTSPDDVSTTHEWDFTKRMIRLQLQAWPAGVEEAWQRHSPQLLDQEEETRLDDWCCMLP